LPVLPDLRERKGEERGEKGGRKKRGRERKYGCYAVLGQFLRVLVLLEGKRRKGEEEKGKKKKRKEKKGEEEGRRRAQDLRSTDSDRKGEQ